MRELGIGLIGTGFMGRAHALAFNNARAVFELPVTLSVTAAPGAALAAFPAGAFFETVATIGGPLVGMLSHAGILSTRLDIT